MMIPLPKAKAMAPKKKLKKLNKVIGFDQHQGQQPPFDLSSIQQLNEQHESSSEEEFKGQKVVPKSLDVKFSKQSRYWPEKNEISD